MKYQTLTGIVILAISYSCSTKEIKTTGSIERLDPALDNILSADAKAEIIAEGFVWSEGPLWVESQKMLLWSDVPANKIYKWTEEKGSGLYLNRTGYTGTTPRGGEMGSNGLLLDKDGNLVLCQHGDRRLARMSGTLDMPVSEFQTIASGLGDKRFNSPNDATWYNGAYYLTDPPYGLVKHENDSSKEIPFQGVYRIDEKGNVQVLVDSLTRPNGIAFFPGGKSLLVANSDPGKAKWYQFGVGDLTADGKLPIVSQKVFFDASPYTTEKGLPDGLKIDSKGNVFATGPGGVYIFNSDAKLLGRIKLENASSNCALSTDEKTLYVTNHMYVLRIKLR